VGGLKLQGAATLALFRGGGASLAAKEAHSEDSKRIRADGLSCLWARGQRGGFTITK